MGASTRGRVPLPRRGGRGPQRGSNPARGDRAGNRLGSACSLHHLPNWPPRGSLSASVKREEGVSPQLASGRCFLREERRKAALLSPGHGDGGTRGQVDRETRGHGDGLAGGKYSHGLPGPSPRGPDSTDLHAPQHKPTRALTPDGVCTAPAPPLRQRTSASRGCLSIGPVGTLADGCGAAGQAPEPFPTDTLPCELRGRAGQRAGLPGAPSRRGSRQDASSAVRPRTAPP